MDGQGGDIQISKVEKGQKSWDETGHILYIKIEVLDEYL